MHKLLQESKRIKSQADKILKESRIVEILSEYGEVKIAGSYTLDLMLRPDLDFYVIAEKHDWQKVLNIQANMMKTKYFRDLYFINWFDFENKQTGNTKEWIPSFKGYYFAAVVPLENQRWKIDIWLIAPEYDKSVKKTDHFKKLIDKSNKSKKIAILKIKKAMRQGKKYTKGVDGEFIYKAVLENNITTIKDFKKYLAKQKK